MAKKKVSSQKAPDPLIDSPEQAMNLLFEAEAKSMAQLFENEVQEQKDQNELAQAATKEEVKELNSLPDFSNLLASEIKSKPKKGPEK